MECPKCIGTGYLSRVKVLSLNLLLRVCSHCTGIWVEGENVQIPSQINLAQFIKARRISKYDLFDVAEDPMRKKA